MGGYGRGRRRAKWELVMAFGMGLRMGWGFEVRGWGDRG